MSLVSLNNEFTDKNTSHSYLPVYDLLLSSIKNTAKNVLEIGVDQGGSIKLWYDYFPNATIYGCDINDGIKIDSIKNNDRIILNLKDNAYTQKYVNHFINNKIKFDLIVDDGPHTLESMILCIHLYSPLLTENGILIIEDIQAKKWLNILTNITPNHLKPYIKTYNLKKIKNRYDDILFTIDLLHKK